MSEISIYFLKTKKDGFTIHSVPLSSNFDILDEFITNEIEKSNVSEVKDYFQIYHLEHNSKTYFSVSNEHISDELNKVVREITLNNSSIEPISKFKPRKGSKDKYPFEAFAILKKEANGEFAIGFENISPTFKLYMRKNLLLKLGVNCVLSQPDSIFLIPDYTSIIVDGTWNAQTIQIKSVLLRSKSSLFFEKLFKYRNHWKGKAQEIVNQYKLFDINEETWNEYIHDIRNVRKFVRTFYDDNMADKLPHIEEYYRIENLKPKLGFEIKYDDNDDAKILISSVNHLKNFIGAYLKNISKTALPSEQEKYFIAPIKEEL